MNIYLIAVGTKMPDWVTRAYNEYAQRLPTKCALLLKEIPAEKRMKNSNINAITDKVPNNCRVVALDVKGQSWSTEKLASRMQDWMMGGQDVAMIIGGPDGINQTILNMAQEKWSLSALTFPHPLVRVILAEQIYRAFTVTENHPYHRAG